MLWKQNEFRIIQLVRDSQWENETHMFTAVIYRIIVNDAMIEKGVPDPESNEAFYHY